MIYNYDFDIAAIILCVLVYVYYFFTRHIKNSKTNAFRTFLVCALFTAVLDIIGGEVIIRQASPFVTYTVNMSYYLVEQIGNFCFFMYVISHLEMRSYMTKLRKFCMICPIIIMSFVILTNPIHGLVFTYHDFVYKSGPFRVCIVLLPILYFVWAVLYAFFKKKALKRGERILIYSIATINVGARIIQFFYSGFLIYCYALAISALLLYLYHIKTDKSIDSDTGLASRSVLEDEVNRLMFNRVPFESIFIRIADYDLITTSYGIQSTEEYMNYIASYIGELSKHGPAYQVSNSCYVLNLYRNEDIAEVKTEICQFLNQSYHIGEVELYCSYFVSSVNYPKQIMDYESYIAALTYFQKMHGLRYGIIPFEELKIKDKARESQVERAIDKAIKNKSFEVFYQPICTTMEQKFITAEALVRLFDDELGMISPAEFIPLAEANGTIATIGNIVLEKVCEFIHTHDMKQLGLEYIEINLSTIQCLQRNFIEIVDRIVGKYQVDTKYISFEITETAANCAPVIFTENLKLLGERGYRLALDDFGTGYANLQRLVTSQFDIIKFDREMTKKSFEDPKLHGFFETLHNMFHSMNAEVVAEGVETEEQYEFLKTIGCDFIQGYYFSKPLPELDFIEFLNRK